MKLENMIRAAGVAWRQECGLPPQRFRAPTPEPRPYLSSLISFLPSWGWLWQDVFIKWLGPDNLQGLVKSFTATTPPMKRKNPDDGVDGLGWSKIMMFLETFFCR